MAYTPKKWVSGEKITADALNHLENGVASQQVGPQGPAGPKGDKGDPGVGVPTGGASGQVLAKRSATNYDTQWIDPPEGGGAGVSSFNGRTGAVVPAEGDYTAAMVGALSTNGGTMDGGLTIASFPTYIRFNGDPSYTSIAITFYKYSNNDVGITNKSTNSHSASNNWVILRGVAAPAHDGDAVNKQYVDSRMRVLTQDEYDALTSKDPEILYLIKE